MAWHHSHKPIRSYATKGMASLSELMILWSPFCHKMATLAWASPSYLCYKCYSMPVLQRICNILSYWTAYQWLGIASLAQLMLFLRRIWSRINLGSAAYYSNALLSLTWDEVIKALHAYNSLQEMFGFAKKKIKYIVSHTYLAGITSAEHQIWILYDAGKHCLW